MTFPLLDNDSAPEASKPILKTTENAYGFIPNIYRVMAHSPVAVSAYDHINRQLEEHGSLTPEEQQMVMLEVSRINGCDYCTAAHRVVGKMKGLSKETIDSIMKNHELPFPQEAALIRFTSQVVEERGWVGEEALTAFLDAGYKTRQILDILSIVAMKTLSNYTNHMAATPVDEAFSGE